MRITWSSTWPMFTTSVAAITANAMVRVAKPRTMRPDSVLAAFAMNVRMCVGGCILRAREGDIDACTIHGFTGSRARHARDAGLRRIGQAEDRDPRARGDRQPRSGSGEAR